MKTKNILLLASILALLGFGIVLKTLSQSMDPTVIRSSEIPGQPPIFHFDPAKAERILMGKGAAAIPVELTLENKEWKVKSLWNAVADSGKVKRLLEKLSTAKGELRGTGKNLFPDFGITDLDALSVKIIGPGDQTLLDLRVGVKEAGRDGYFLRKAGSDEVYLVAEDMADLLGIYVPFTEGKPIGDYWADVTLLNVNPDNVTKIEVFHFKEGVKTAVAGVIFAADKTDPKKKTWQWIRTDLKTPVDPDKVVRFIAMVNSIKSQKVVDPNGQGYGFDKPILEVRITEGNKEKVLTAGTKNEKEGMQFVKTSASPSIFIVAPYFINDLDLDDTRFFKETPPAAAADAKAPSSANQNSGKQAS